MLAKPDYQQIIEFNHRLNSTLKVRSENIRPLGELIEGINLNAKLEDHYISKPLYDYLSLHNLLSTKADEIPISTFLWIYCHYHWGSLNEITYEEAKNDIINDKVSHLTHLKNQFQKTLLQYLVLNKKMSWSSLIKTLDYSNWDEINTSAYLLPLSDTHLTEVITWATSIIKTYGNIKPLGTLHFIIESWMLLTPHGIDEVSSNICDIARHPEASYLLKSFLTAGQILNPKDLDYFIKKFENLIEPYNGGPIFMALAQNCLNSSKAKADFFNLLLTKFNTKKIQASDFFYICGLYVFYEEAVFESIERELVENDCDNTINSICLYLQVVPTEVELRWYYGSLQLIFCKMRPELKHAQNQLLAAIADTNLNLAYDLFEFRMKIMGGNEFLEEGLTNVVRHNARQFQERFVNWLVMDDNYVHTGLRYITFAQSLDPSLFNIPKDFFLKLSIKQKLYAAYKIVGFIYSTEELQQLLISLAISIEEDNEVLEKNLYFIFSKYLIYNYRGTLKLLKKELEKNELPNFARNLFWKIIQEYQAYFDALNNIVVDKELKPYPVQVQLRSFYFSQMFSDFSIKERKKSITSLFKNVSINSQKWEIRRKKGEESNHRPIHQPQPLAKISVTQEYPSGEKLNPVFQEEIRRTYQNIRMDEIRSH